MAAAFHGRGGTLEIASDAIGSVISIEQTAENEDVETTAMGDATRSYLAGIPGGGGTVVMNWDMAAQATPNAGQVALETAAAAGTPVTITWYPTGKTTTHSMYSGSVVITAAGVGADVGGLISYRVTYRGVLVRSTYTA